MPGGQSPHNTRPPGSPRQLDEEPTLAACGVIVQREPPAVHSGIPLPLQLVHVVPAVRVLPPALVVLEAAVPGTGGSHLGGGGADTGGNGNVIYGDVAQSVTTNNTLEDDLRSRGDF